MRPVVLAGFVLGSAACSALIGVSGDAVISDVADGGAANGDGGDGGDASVVPIVDTGADSGQVDAGSPFSTPGSILCAGAACPVPAYVCCEDPGTGAGFCRPAGAGCTGVVRACDESSDCPATEACCLVKVYPATVATACKATCDPGQARLCATPSDCAGGAPCLGVTCAGRPVRTCNGEGTDAGCK